jgi:hypothetical protein
MRPLSHRLVLAALIAAGLLVPTAASAVTVDEIVALARGGVTDAVILALIDRDKTIFSLGADQVVALKAEGVSEPVIIAMLKSGREEGERAAQEASDLTAAMILAERSSGPEVLVVDRGPDVPSGTRSDGFYSGPPPGGYFMPVPYVVNGGGRRRSRFAPPAAAPFVAPFASPFRQNAAPPAIAPVVPPVGSVVPPIGTVVPPIAPGRTDPPVSRVLCRAQVSGASSTQPLTFITECPAAMQPSRRR